MKEKTGVNFMSGNIYNVGLLHFLLKNIYKYNKENMKKYYFAHHRRKHLKIAVALIMALKKVGSESLTWFRVQYWIY